MEHKVTSRPEHFAVVGPGLYNDRLAYATLDHALGSYGSPSAYARSVVAAGFEGGTVIESGAAQVAIAYSDRVIVVSPRGSEEAGDCRDDFLSVFRWPWQLAAPFECWMGLGFVRQAKAVLPELLSWLWWLRKLRPHLPIFIGGHSLGAALSPILVAALKAKGIPVVACYAHASPRTGNRKWAQWYDRKFTHGATPTFSTVNVKNGQPDLVTRVPKRSWGAKHLGVRVVHDRGRRHVGAGAWRRHQERSPVSHLVGWRIVSKLRSSLGAHRGVGMLEDFSVHWSPEREDAE